MHDFSRQIFGKHKAYFFKTTFDIFIFYLLSEFIIRVIVYIDTILNYIKRRVADGKFKGVNICRSKVKDNGTAA